MKKGFYIFAKGGQSVTLILEGRPYTVASDNPRYDELVEAIKADDWTRIDTVVNAAVSYGPILKAFGDVVVYGGHVLYQGRELHNYLVTKILEAGAGDFPIEPLGRFMENVLKNPDKRAQNDLYDWCEHSGLPLTEDGHIIAYKAVRGDYLDHYTRTLDHTPGKVVEMDRNACDPDPARTCSNGLHFCSAGYLPRYHAGASRIVLVKIHPADVVAFPRDYGWEKGRACRYEVIEEIPPETVEAHFEGVTAYYPPKPKVGDLVKLKEGAGSYFGSPQEGLIYEVMNVDLTKQYLHSGKFAGSIGALRIKIDGREKDFDYPIAAFDVVPAPEPFVFIFGIDFGAALTFEQRLAECEEKLGLDAKETIPERLDAIEHELGITDPLEPMIARLERAERQLSL